MIPGYRYGPGRVPVRMLVDSATADIVAGDMLVEGTAGYVQAAAAGANTLIGVAMETVASPAADGGASVLVDICGESIYEYAPDAGTVTVALVNKTMDVGGARTIDIDASADDIVRCVDVSTDRNTVFVKFTFAGTGVA